MISGQPRLSPSRAYRAACCALNSTMPAGYVAKHAGGSSSFSSALTQLAWIASSRGSGGVRRKRRGIACRIGADLFFVYKKKE